MKIIFLILAIVLSASLAYADTADRAIKAPTGEVACAIGAFVTETDRAGLNVRSGPGAGFRIIGRLPPVTFSKEIEGLVVMPEVEILASAKGWFKIRNARDNVSLSGAKARTMYKGTGWVSGQKLTIKTQASDGHAAPDALAKSIFKFTTGAPLDDERLRDVGHLVGCSGLWALVEYGPLPAEMKEEQELQIDPAASAGLHKGHFRAWVDRVCALQETSCSGF